MKIYLILTGGSGLALLIAFIGSAAFNTAWPETTLPLWLQMAIAYTWGSTGMLIAIRMGIGELE